MTQDKTISRLFSFGLVAATAALLIGMLFQPAPALFS